MGASKPATLTRFSEGGTAINEGRGRQPRRHCPRSIITPPLAAAIEKACSPVHQSVLAVHVVGGAQARAVLWWWWWLWGGGRGGGGRGGVAR